MIQYVEHDDDGNLVSSVQIFTAEGNSVEQERPGLTKEERQERQERVELAVAEKEAETLSALEEASKNANLIVLPPEAELPDVLAHKLDLKSGEIVTRTKEDRDRYREMLLARPESD